MRSPGVSRDRRPHAVLFDLDGTLADTGKDLAYALNQTLQHFEQPALPYEIIRPVVSHGGIALIKLGFGIVPESPGFEERRQFLLDVYKDNLCRETRLFPGMDVVLADLESRHLPWGIVTNKPAWLTDPLIAAMQLEQRAGCVISGDTCEKRKPHPQPILHACELLDCEPKRTWYIGDAGRDIEAGRAAGCVTVGALYGYLHPEDPPDAWQSDLTIDKPEQLLDLLNDDSSAA
jgi:phosphoglycolate phosphatase